MNAPQKVDADFAIVNAVVITMDAGRRVIMDGAVAVKGARILEVGRTGDVLSRVAPRSIVDGRDLVVTPGFVNGHVHVTGDPLTRHYMPDNFDHPDKLTTWVLPRYYAHTADDERLSAKYCALQLMKSGTTTFIEAGTIRYLDEAIAGLNDAGIRGRVGAWVEGRAYDTASDQARLIDEAVRTLEDETARYPETESARIAAWPILVGHSTNPDEVWKAAKAIADAKGLRVAAHMSPYASDPEWFLSTMGKRPVVHLADIGALGPNVILTHATHLDGAEVDTLAASGAGVAFCPFASLKGAFGVSSSGRYLDMLAAGVLIMMATDGFDCDLLPATRLCAGLLKDLAGDVTATSSLMMLEALTCTGAKIMGLDAEIGSLEPGKRADILCFDTRHTQWRPLLSPLDQLIWSADARSLKTVYVDGEPVIENGCSTRLDEGALLDEVQAAGERIIARSGLPFERDWQTL